MCIDLVRGEGCRSRIAKTCHVVPPILLINLGWSSHPNRVSKFFLLLFEYFDTHTPRDASYYSGQLIARIVMCLIAGVV